MNGITCSVAIVIPTLARKVKYKSLCFGLIRSRKLLIFKYYELMMHKLAYRCLFTTEKLHQDDSFFFNMLSHSFFNMLSHSISVFPAYSNLVCCYLLSDHQT